MLHGAHASDNGEDGFRVDTNSAIYGINQPMTADDNVWAGFRSQTNSTVVAPSAVATGNDGAGFIALNESFIDAYQSAGGTPDNGNGQQGYYALHSATILVRGSEASSNTGDGYLAGLNSLVDAVGSTGTGNGGYAFSATRGGYVRMGAASTTGAMGTGNPTPVVDNSGGAIIQNGD